MMPRPHSSSARHALRRWESAGFSLVEIMVALVIGMIGVLIIMQVARTAEAQKRITTGSGNSQTNAALGIYSVQRDIRQAGYGFNSLNVLGCRLTIPARGSLPAHTLNVLAPVTINPPDEEVPAGDAGTDTLLVVHGNSVSAPEGDTIVSVEPLGTKERLGVTSAANFRSGDWVVVAPHIPKAGCALKMEQIEVHAPTLDVPNSGAQVSQNLFDLGSLPKIVAYAIRHGNLTSCDYMQADCGDHDEAKMKENWPIVANGIVSLRAQYGHDTGSPGDIDRWNQTAPAQSTPPDQEKFACSWARISAVRLALTARNGEPAGRECANDDSACPTQAAPVWAGGKEGDDNPTPVLIDLSSANTAWKHYRYQVYETVMPLRNMPWMGSCLL